MTFYSKILPDYLQMKEANRYDWILFGLSKLVKTYNFLL